MSNKILISSGSPLEPLIGFSRACRMGNIIAVSGTAPIEEGKTVFKGDLYQQAKHCLKLSMRAVQQAGASVENIIRTRIYLTDISRWQEAAKAHGELFADHKPACTFVEVKGLIDPDWLIETEMDAVLPDE